MTDLRKIKFKEFIKLQRGFDLPKKDMVDGPYPVVGSTSIIGYHNEYKVNQPGVITGRSGSLGKLQYINKKYWPHNTSLWTKDFKGNNPRYVYYFLHTINFNNFNAGAGVPTLNRNHLDNYDISINEGFDQNKIALILSNYDDLIENNTKRIELLEKIATLIYDEWFVKFKFPRHEKVKMVNSELGKIPEGWGVKKIDEIIKHRIKINKKIKRSEYLEQGDIPCVDQSRNFIAGYTNDKGAVFDEFLPVVVFGDHTRIVKFVNFPFACGADGTQLIFPENENISPEFLYFLLINIALSNFHYARHFKFLKGKKIIIPKEDIMETFNEIIKPIMMMIPLFRDKTINLHKTRDLLLPKLISGQVDVSGLDIKVPEMQEVVV